MEIFKMILVVIFASTVAGFVSHKLETPTLVTAAIGAAFVLIIFRLMGVLE